MPPSRSAKGARKLRTLGGVQTVTTEEDWRRIVLSSDDKLVFVEFFAPWAQQNSQFKVLMQKLASQPEYRNIRFVRADVEKLKDIARRSGVVKVPTFQCYRNGQRLESATLVVPQKIIDMLERHRQQGGGQKNRLAVFLATLASIGLATFGIVYFVKRNSDDFDDAGGEDGSAWEKGEGAEGDEDDERGGHRRRGKRSKRRKKRREYVAPTATQGMIAPLKKENTGPTAVAKHEESDKGPSNKDDDISFY